MKRPRVEVDEEEALAVAQACRRAVGDLEDLAPPDGWRHLPLCIVDSVFSLRLNYDSHVRPVLERFAERTSIRLEGLPDDVFASDPDEVGISQLLDDYRGWDERRLADELFGARYTTPGAGTLKAGAAFEAARRLRKQGVDIRRDLIERSAEDDAVKQAWLDVSGLGMASWRYVLILAGAEEVKPDIMIRRFVAGALKEDIDQVPAARAAALFKEAHRRLRENHPSLSLRTLDHAVWRVQSGRNLR